MALTEKTSLISDVRVLVSPGGGDGCGIGLKPARGRLFWSAGAGEAGARSDNRKKRPDAVVRSNPEELQQEQEVCVRRGARAVGLEILRRREGRGVSNQYPAAPATANGNITDVISDAVLVKADGRDIYACIGIPNCSAGGREAE
ncbi:hypothetical protein C8J57DRAFT_1240106 [Mycena rebaudengoi]|nr:hypothetical protein C8J57DRAFT_1240106 [Mycena rebaudengoi]